VARVSTLSVDCHTRFMSAVSASPRRPRGRPTNPDIEKNVHQAAVEIYAEVGWAGFTYDAIASRSGVGKAALYRRWASKVDILRSAIREASIGWVEVPNTGSLRGDLIVVVAALADRLTKPVGIAELRMMIDQKVFPDDFNFDLSESHAHSRSLAVETVKRAIARDELPANTRPEAVFDMARGAMIHNFLMVPPSLEPQWRARLPLLPEEIVDRVLRGLQEPAS